MAALRRIPVSAEAAGSGESARRLCGGDRDAAGARDSAGQAGIFPGERGAGGAAQQSARPKAGIPPLAVYNPIHYQELPELFMDFICSLTGKSPATTGFGSEGALTKGPFNALGPW